MMSTSKQLDKRAATALLTWAKQHSNVHIEIFANPKGENDKQSHDFTTLLGKDVPLIQLPGVRDDAYPSQKKSFSMIKYMYDTHIDR